MTNRFNINGLKPYPKYKESGLPWLEKMPEHWRNNPGFAAFREKQIKNVGMREKMVLSLSYGRIVIKPPEKLHGLVPESFETYQIVEPGDIIIRSTDLQNDWNSLRVGLVRDRGIITSAYLCLKTTDILIPEYGYLLLHALDLMKIFYGLGSGLRQNLSFIDFKRMLIFVPPLPEQSAITRFIDQSNRKIDRFIRSKLRFIELLKEQKQVIIHKAVIRGLDQNAQLKPSGVDWLGDIPEHWEVSRVKVEFNCLNTHRIPLSGIEREKMKLRQYDYYGASGVIDKVDEYIFNDELLLIAEDGANLVLRNLPLAIIARGKFWVNNHAHILKLKRGNLDYFANVLECIDYRPWITGAAQPKLTKDRLMAISIPAPPINEQNQIIEWIEAETSTLQSAISRTHHEITLLREYRTRLITDVVTGKLAMDEAEVLEDMDASEDPNGVNN